MEAEEILKKCTENALKCNVVYNMSQDAIIQAMDEYANQLVKQKQSEIDELVAYLKNYNHLTKSEINELIQKHTKK